MPELYFVYAIMHDDGSCMMLCIRVYFTPGRLARFRLIGHTHYQLQMMPRLYY